MVNTANLGLFAVHKFVSEYAERLYVYMEKTPRATKLCLSQLIIKQILIFLKIPSLYIIWDGLQKPSHAAVPLRSDQSEMA
jgi:hypothetical protein